MKLGIHMNIADEFSLRVCCKTGLPAVIGAQNINTFDSREFKSMRLIGVH